MIKISIIIPVYNVEKYVLRCLNSIANQTYLESLECLLVDDCGTDNSVQIVEDFIANYQGSVQFRLLHHDHNRGLSAARNTGLDAAVGEYVFFLDSDDELPINSIELLTSMLETYPSVEIIQGTITSVPNNPYYEMDCFKETPIIKDNTLIRKSFYATGKTIPVNGVNKLIKRTFLTQNKLFFQEGLLHEDEHWMFYVVKYLQDLVFVFEPTYIRYYNEGSIMMTMNPEKEGRNWGAIILDWIEHCDEPLYLEQLRKIMHKYSSWQVYNYIQFKENIQLIKKISIKILHHWRLKSLFLFYLWLFIKPIKNIKKILRFSYQAL